MDVDIRLRTPRALYVHVPFCRRRCGYCNFAITTRSEFVAEYLRALKLELERLGGPFPIDSVFIGGGTPTLLPMPQWCELLESIRRFCQGPTVAEWTIEANPEDLSEPAGGDKLKVATELGVTRWSLGIQSFRDEKRRRLEREHSAEDIAVALERCRDTRSQLSVDLIFASPGETLHEWREDLRQLLQNRVDHVSTYGLTYEKGSPFWSRKLRGELSELADETQRQMYLAARHMLVEQGFEHYEVSNFALPGKRCRHNETYWQCRPYFAVGPGAARYVGGVRELNHRSTTTWMRRVLQGDSPVEEREVIGPELAAREQLVFGLRQLDGVDVAEFEQSTGFAVRELCGPEFDWYLESGWWRLYQGRLALTETGLLISDSLWPPLLEAEHRG